MKKKSLLCLFLFIHLTGYSADFGLERNLLDKGMTYFYQKNYKAAADYLGQAADLNRNNVWARYYYVYAIALLGKKQEASKWLPRLSSISKTPHYKQLVAFLNSDNGKQSTQNTKKKNEKPNKIADVEYRVPRSNETKLIQSVTNNTEYRFPHTTEEAKQNRLTANSKQTATQKTKKPDILDEVEYYIDSGDKEKALTIIKDYMKTNPTDGRGYKLLAMLDFSERDYQSSAKNFEKAFRGGINDFDSYFMAAQSNLDIQNYDTALVYYEKASQINSKDLFVRISLADLYCDRSDYVNSARIYKEILKDNPNNIDAKIGLAKIEFNKGYLEESLEMVSTIVDENPDSAKAHYLKSQILLEKLDYDNALKEAEAAYTYNPSSIEYRVFCSIVKVRNFKINEAVEDLKEVLNTFPDNTYALTALGEAQLTDGNMEEGKATLLKSESIKKMPQTALLLALIECNNKNYDKADSLYKEYCLLAGNSPGALLEYANFTELKENKEECLKSYYAVLEKFPGTPFADKAEQRANEIKKSNSKQSRKEYGIY